MSEIVPTASLGAVREKKRGVRVTPLLFFLALVAGLLGVSEKMLQDPDTQWHIAVGRWIWESHSVPWIDVFSHTLAGSDWIAKEWLSQLIFYGAFAAAGWRGVAVLTAIVDRRLVRAALPMAPQPHQFDGRPSPCRSRLRLGDHQHARPAASARFSHSNPLDRRPRRGLPRGERPPWRLVALMTLWANVHGSFRDRVRARWHSCARGDVSRPATTTPSSGAGVERVPRRSRPRRLRDPVRLPLHVGHGHFA